jgi:hypothetical protein
MLFRHALLRDLAMLCWAATKATSRSKTLQVLDGILGPIVRWGAVRAAIEASVAPAAFRAGFAGVGDLLSASAIQGQATAQMVADVVGELEDPSAVDLSRLAFDYRAARHAPFNHSSLRRFSPQMDLSHLHSPVKRRQTSASWRRTWDHRLRPPGTTDTEVEMFCASLEPGGLLVMEHTQKLPPEVAHLFERAAPDADLHCKRTRP